MASFSHSHHDTPEGMQYHCNDMSVYREEECDMIWSPVSTSSGQLSDLNSSMARFAMPTGSDDWSWRSSQSSLLFNPSEQAFCITEPVSRIPEMDSVGTTDYFVSHGPGIPIINSQWPYEMAPHVQYEQMCQTMYQNTQDNYPAPPHATRSSANDSHAPPQVPWPDVFASIKGRYYDPEDAAGDAQPQRKNKRSKDDLYTPQWVRNSGTQREGWCGWCQDWFTLRDSTYWYHMHYSHGISQIDGKRLPAPAGFRTFCESSEWEVKCGKCTRWMPLPSGERWNTAYFRHTYKCYFKAGGKIEQSTAGSTPTDMISPVRRL